jgi:hypothetical protein
MTPRERIATKINLAYLFDFLAREKKDHHVTQGTTAMCDGNSP